MNQTNLVVSLIQIFLPLVLAFLFVYKYVDIRTKTTHFVCPLCRSRFKLSKSQFAFALKTGALNERVVTCPACGYKGRMPIIKD
ncbi:hypothetical protein DQG23_29780 [Paenibacillus contaminans]|uniref:Uncharacterized protein n=1 Tax=Paenibacillus contaminans TaxID=450362 RepID=A0A329M7C7_9BACL|nr:hypothetical protein DQG23_29780 [Paenibacillus contaminans]